MILGLDRFFGGSKPAETPKQMGYEPSAGMKHLMEYTGKVHFSGEGAERFADRIYNALGDGSLDQATAMAMINSRIRPDDDFFKKGREFGRILNYKMGPTKSKNMIQDELLGSFNRYGDAAEVDRLYGEAERAGVLNNPNELRNYLATNFARKPEGISKDMNPYLADRGRYGPIVQDAEGRFRGYDVFLGDEAKYEAAHNIINSANDFAQNTLARLGAKGEFA